MLSRPTSYPVDRRPRPTVFVVVAITLLAILSACGEDQSRGTVRDDPNRPAYQPEAERHPVVVRQPEGPPTIATDLVDFHGNPVGVACSVCHSVLDAKHETHSSDQLQQFHQGLHFNHGGLSCVACHDPRNYDQLRRADGTAVDFPNVMQSCAQCHGKQKRDFDRGLHGGMAGYWDTTRGPRFRNNCIDCHDPHAPAYPAVTPVLPPDRSDWTSQLSRTLQEVTHE